MISKETIHGIIGKYMRMDLRVGDIVYHPKDGRVKILSGCYFDPIYGRLSNWWDWVCVDEHGKRVGKPKSGYGWM